MSPRYALYFAPPRRPSVVGRRLRLAGPRRRVGRASAAAARHRADPRRYGFHATLKPPFALREGATRSQLLAALSHFADERAPFDMPPLRVATLGDFVALRPVEHDATAAGRPLRALADDCVRLFDEFRAPALGRRAGAPPVRPGSTRCSARTSLRWGYPHVFDRWRFHMT